MHYYDRRLVKQAFSSLLVITFLGAMIFLLNQISTQKNPIPTVLGIKKGGE